MQAIQWETIPLEQMSARISRRVWHGEKMTTAQVNLLEGAQVPLHHHHHEQTTVLISGKLLFRMGGAEITLLPGEMLRIPPHLPHEVVAMEDSVAVDWFAPVRDDWQRGEDAYLRG
ncbi:MAG: cupin domain-containing protein [Bryobacterales bacterium]|jgi:quercetin dioxygenase-like cupin family protein|nr:cupin domain-containing protein [Bryobacterales bacterium]